MPKNSNKKNNDLDNFVQNSVKFGIGMTYLTLDSVTKAMKKLEKQGKINKKESEKFVNDMVKEYKTKGALYAKEMQKQMKKQTGKLAKNAPLVSQKDIDALNAKAAELSKQLDRQLKKQMKKKH